VEATDTISRPDVTLGDFVKQLVAILSKENVTIPFEDSAPWHLLFYQLKKNPDLRVGRPKFFDSLLFDWDGLYPKSRRLEEYLQRLHWNAGVEADNPGWGSIRVEGRLADIWRTQAEALPQEYRAFLDRAATIARERFPSSE
jgi:hypothetical protein